MTGWLVWASIAVTSIYESMVGIHQQKIGIPNDPTDIFFTFDSINKLEMAIDEAKKKIEELDIETKKKRRLNEGKFCDWNKIKDTILEGVAKHCGRAYI